MGATLIVRQSLTNVMKPSNGLMAIKWLRRMNTKTNRKNWKAFVIRSSLRCTKEPKDLKEGQEGRLKEEVPQDRVQLLRKLIKITNNKCCLFKHIIYILHNHLMH